MEQMSTLISACMTGNLERLSSDYELTFKENEGQYWIAVVPQGSAKAYMKCIDIFLDKKDFFVHQLKITESSDDYTEYVFTGQKKNVVFPDAKFAIK
jgi:outer membrane lipoprotein-sorting protein